MTGSVALVRTDSESVYAHGAFAKYRQDGGIRVSPSAPNLKQMNNQSERCFGIALHITCTLHTSSGLTESCFPLDVYHATYLKIAYRAELWTTVRLPPCFFVYNPDSSHLRIVGSQLQAFSHNKSAKSN